MATKAGICLKERELGTMGEKIDNIDRSVTELKQEIKINHKSIMDILQQFPDKYVTRPEFTEFTKDYKTKIQTNSGRYWDMAKAILLPATAIIVGIILSKALGL